MHPKADEGLQLPLKSSGDLLDNDHTDSDPTRQEIVSFIDNAQGAIDNLSRRCEELDRLDEILPIIKKEISGQIDQSIRMLQRALIERQGTLLSEMEASITARKEIANKTHAEFEARLQRLLSHVDLLKRLLHVPPFAPDTSKQACGTTRNFAIQKHKQEIEKLLQQPVPSYPSEFDNMSFFPIELDQLLSMIRSAGAVVLTSIDAHSTTLTGEPKFPEHVRSCEVGAETVVDIVPCDRQGRIVHDAKLKEFTVAVNSRAGQGSSVEVRERTGYTENQSDSQTHLQLVHRLCSPGMYDMSVKLYGEHINGSPYLIHARPAITPNIEAWIDKIKETSHMPVRVNATLATRRRCRSACPPPGEPDTPPALADVNRLERGDLLFSIGIKGRGDGEFANPTGICVTRENKIIVADCNNATIQAS